MALTDEQIDALAPRDGAYRFTDGGGLVIEVSPRGTKTFRFRFIGPQKRTGI